MSQEDNYEDNYERILLYYLLLKSREPRIIKRVTQRRYPAGPISKTHGSLEGVTRDQHFTHAYGGIYADNNAVDSAIAAAFTQITIFTTKCGEENIVSSAPQDHLEIVVAGTYMITVAINAHAGAADDYYFAVHKNDGTVELDNLECELRSDVAGRLVNTVIAGMRPFVAGDTVELWCKTAGGPKNLTITHISMCAVRIGT